MSDIDNLLGGTLDDLADMPEFKHFPDGVHKVRFDFVAKEVNKKPGVELKFTAIETMELSDATKDTPIIAGDETSVLLLFKNNDGSKNEFSEGTLKMVVGALREQFPGSNNGEILTAAKGAEVVIVTKLKENKNNPGVFNMGLKKFYLV